MIKLAFFCAIIGAVLVNWPHKDKPEAPAKANLAKVCGSVAK
jgi:hypothetical protein